MSLPSILKQQIAWAGARPRRAHVLDRPEDNLFAPLHPATYAEFARASGNELGLRGGTAKMRSLRSSSVLACNVFDPWRGHSLASLSAALGLAGDQFSEIAFEYKLPHGLPSLPPNIDLILFGRETAPVGVEAKFAEPYGKRGAHAPLDPKYFTGDRRRWVEVGLPKSQALAQAIGTSTSFCRFNAGQLVKHILGLGTSFPTLRPIRLRYVWFDADGAEDRSHRNEIARFADHIGEEVDFASVSYQELFARVAAGPEPAAGYHSYLRARYFPTA